MCVCVCVCVGRRRDVNQGCIEGGGGYLVDSLIDIVHYDYADFGKPEETKQRPPPSLNSGPRHITADHVIYIQ